MKVVFVIGAGRSGSTLLDMLLGEIPGFFSVGELPAIWQRASHTNQCGCGSPLLECPVWGQILRSLFPSEDPSAESSLVWQIQRSTVRERSIRTVLSGEAKRSTQFTRYAEATGALYDAIAHHESPRVIVNSSKSPVEAAVLLGVPSVDPYFIHLVRDPRAVVHSVHRRTRSHRTTSNIVREWVARNVAAEMVYRRVPPERRMFLRYREFVSKPDATLRGICNMIGEDPGTLDFLEGAAATFSVNHTVSGNSSRFRTGKVPLVPDHEWMDLLPAKDRMITVSLAGPLMVRYGYLSRTDPVPRH